jgi:CSLREA domain-containing protein
MLGTRAVRMAGPWFAACLLASIALLTWASAASALPTAPATTTLPGMSRPALVVNSAGDDANSAGAACLTALGTCTLRAAIQAADTAGLATTIRFDIPGSGVQQITPLTPLPAITAPVTIDGYTQPGAAPATASAAAQILISIVGPRSSANKFPGDGLLLSSSASGSMVRGLQVSGFVGFGIHVQAANTRVSGDRIGSDSFFQPNQSGGVEIDTAGGDVIGGMHPADRNVISGAHGPGVEDSNGHDNVIEGDYIGPDATGAAITVPNVIGVEVSVASGDRILDDVISGNYGNGVEVAGGDHVVIAGNEIGLDRTGEHPLGNGVDGIFVANSPQALIGGNGPAARNVVSANGDQGIAVTGASADVRILGNYVGSDADGTAFDSNSGPFGGSSVFGNALDGIFVNGVPGAVIGAPGAGNLVNNNGFAVNQAPSGLAEIRVVGSAATNATIQANMIGVTHTGAPLGTPLTGLANAIEIDNVGGGLRIGGPQPGEGNVASDSQNAGIVVFGVPSGFIQGNLVGTDASGTIAAGDNTAQSGEVSVINSSNVQIGGSGAPTRFSGSASQALRRLGAGNLVSNSSFFGVVIAGGSGNSLQGNLIGTDITGEQAFPNVHCGVIIQGQQGQSASATKVRDNVVSASGLHGIEIGQASGTVVQGNRIGTDASGTKALGDVVTGIALLFLGNADTSGPSDTLIGGSAPGQGNLISGNGSQGSGGIQVGAPGNPAASTTATTILGNRIGTDVSGTKPIPNTSAGVELDDGAQGVTIGGTAAGDGNLISGNAGEGILLRGATQNVQVLGNRIGIDPSGKPLGNTFDGVGINQGSNNDVIGGVGRGQGNVIADNGNDGVYVTGAQGATIRGNSIFANHHLGIELSTGSNNSQPAPQLTGAQSAGHITTVSGTLSAQPNTAYTIDFYANQPTSGAGGVQGKTWVGAETVQTDGSGSVHFSYSSSRFTGPTTATATDPSGNTSAFSAPAS